MGLRYINKFLYRPRKEEDGEEKILKMNESKEEGKGRGICRYEKMNGWQKRGKIQYIKTRHLKKLKPLINVSWLS
jgi:hypothetical protein